MTLLSAITAGASAATLGVNSATAASWNDGDNTNTSGTPFGNWSLVANPGQGGFAGFFTGDSKDLDTGSGADINSPSTSFGMFGNQGGNADAFLVLSSALSVGQSLSFDLGVNFRNGNKGVDIRDGSDTVIFNFNIGTDDHVVNNATTGNGSTGNAYSANTAFNNVRSKMTDRPTQRTTAQYTSHDQILIAISRHTQTRYEQIDYFDHYNNFTSEHYF